MKELSYIMLGEGKAKVTCTCGWESEKFDQSPFDPGEAVIAYGVEHLVCLEHPPEVFYAVAQVMYGKMNILSTLDSSPGAQERAVELAKGVNQKGMTKHVLEIKISSSWVG